LGLPMSDGLSSGSESSGQSGRICGTAPPSSLFLI
jgi:hypothetical protein